MIFLVCLCFVCDCLTEIDNTFFEFSNQELYDIEKRALLLQTGTLILEECQSVVSQVSLESVTNLLNSLSGSTTAGERKTILTKQLQILADESSQNVSEENKNISDLQFFLRLIKGLIIVILKTLIGPAMVLIFSIYLKLAYGNLNFNTLKEFIVNNSKFYVDMVKRVMIETIQKTLLRFLFIYNWENFLSL